MTISALTPATFPWFDYQRYTFSLGLQVGDEAVLSGHSASEFDREDRKIVVRGGMAEQTNTAYDKIEAILTAAGLDLGDIVRVVENVTVAGIDHFAEADQVRAERLGDNRPAVVTLCVDRLLRDAAWIEVAVVARRGAGPPLSVDTSGRVAYAPARPGADGVVHLSSVLPLDDQGHIMGDDLASQTEAVFDRAGRLLEGAGLDWSNVVQTLDFTTPATLRDYKATRKIRKERLQAPYPAAAGILMSRMAHPDALIQLDLTASTHQLEAVNPGWERYSKLTYSPAVKAGNMLFMSGQAALDPATEQAVHAGDVAAQAEYTYGNIIAVLEAAGCGPEHLIETVEYVTPDGLPRYREVAEVRQRMLQAPWPASTGIVCKGLLRPEFQIEVLPMAILPDSA